MAKQYGKWRIKEKLDEGGQAELFKVTTEGTEEIFVLKRLKNRSRIQRFEREIKAGLSLVHPNIVEYIDSDIEHEHPYIVTKYYQAGSLETWYRNELSLETKLKLFIQICIGVQYAHSQEPQILHRDLKPQNIFVDETGNARIGDFGLCHIEDGERITVTEEAVGSRYFIAPELEDGKSENIGSWFDVYSLGKVLYWLLTDKKVFAREKLLEPEYELCNSRNRNRNYTLCQRLILRMIDADYRLRMDMSEILISLERIMDNVNRIYNSIKAGQVQNCIYCGIGQYKVMADCYVEGSSRYDWGEQSQFMLSQIVDQKTVGAFKIFVCNHCGNTQYFFTDKSGNPDAWK